MDVWFPDDNPKRTRGNCSSNQDAKTNFSFVVNRSGIFGCPKTACDAAGTCIFSSNPWRNLGRDHHLASRIMEDDVSSLPSGRHVGGRVRKDTGVDFWFSVCPYWHTAVICNLNVLQPDSWVQVTMLYRTTCVMAKSNEIHQNAECEAWFCFATLGERHICISCMKRSLHDKNTYSKLYDKMQSWMFRHVKYLGSNWISWVV